MIDLNRRVIIKIGVPLLRPGLEISTEVSYRHLVVAMSDLLDAAGEFNGTRNSFSEDCGEAEDWIDGERLFTGGCMRSDGGIGPPADGLDSCCGGGPSVRKKSRKIKAKAGKRN